MSGGLVLSAILNIREEGGTFSCKNGQRLGAAMLVKETVVLGTRVVGDGVAEEVLPLSARYGKHRGGASGRCLSLSLASPWTSPFSSPCVVASPWFPMNIALEHFVFGLLYFRPSCPTFHSSFRHNYGYPHPASNKKRRVSCAILEPSIN